MFSRPGAVGSGTVAVQYCSSPVRLVRAQVTNRKIYLFVRFILTEPASGDWTAHCETGLADLQNQRFNSERVTEGL